MNTSRKWIIALATLMGLACLGLALVGLAGGAWAWTQNRAPAAGGGSSGTLLPSPSSPPTAFLTLPPTHARPAAPTGVPTDAPLERPAGVNEEPQPGQPLVPQPGSGGPQSSPLPPRVGTPPGSGPLRTPTSGAPVAPPAPPFTGTLNTLDNPWCLPPNSAVTQAQVNRVIDGVTIEVSINGQTRQVRYIGLSLLDYSQDPSVWVRAAEQNRQMVEGRPVLLYRDQVDQDDEGRLLRYVLSSGRFINYELAAAGYANAQSQPPNTRCDAQLRQAESKALAGSLGLWQPTPTATRTLIPQPSPTIAKVGGMVITLIAKRGTIWQEPEEFVEIRNDDSGPIDLKNWSLQDDERHVFVFPHFILGSGQYCRVYTNLYRPASCGFSYDSPSPIWDNDAECAYLKNSQGSLVSTFCYGGP